MASLDDAFNQLKIANTHLTAIDNDLQTVNASVQTVGADEQATTAAVQTGFSELYSLVNYTDQLLQYEIAQNNTIICYLGKIAQQTCALLNEAALQPPHSRRCARTFTTSSNSSSWPTRPQPSSSTASRN